MKTRIVIDMNCPECGKELRKTGKTVSGWDKVPLAGEGLEVFTCLTKNCPNFKKGLILDSATNKPRWIN